MQCENTIALKDAVNNSSFPFDISSTNQVTRIKYDESGFVALAGNNLRGRIAEVEYRDNGAQAMPTSATIYDYSVRSRL